MCHEERKTIEHMGCSEIRERERKERGELLNKDGRKIRWIKEIWKRKGKIEKEKDGRMEGEERRCRMMRERQLSIKRMEVAK
jgi:hypothetical protein